MCCCLQGVVEPHSLCDIPLLIEAQMLEEEDIVAYFSIFGSPDPPLVSHRISMHPLSLQSLQILTNTDKCYTLLTMLALESTDTFTTVTCLNLLFITIYMFSGCTYFLYWRGASRAYNPQWFRLGGRASPDQYSHGHHPLKWIADTSSLHSQHGGYNCQHQKQNKWSSIFKKILPMDWVVYAHICNPTGMSKLSHTCSGTSYLCWWYVTGFPL